MSYRTEKIWFDGNFVNWEEAKVHVLVHALHYGSGVFEGIRCYKTSKGSAIFRLRDHIDRFYNSAKIYFIRIPYSKEELVDAIVKLIKLNGLEECYIRPIAFRGLGGFSLDPCNNIVHMSIAVWPWGEYLGEGVRDRGIKCTISSWIRVQNNMIPMMAKATGQYINSSLACMEAHLKGFDEAIMLDSRGYVSEGSGENIFLVKDNILCTPSTNSSILLGITRDSVIRIAKDIGFNVVERDISKEELFLADELFFTGTAAEITPIVEVDHRRIGDGKVGPVTKSLQEKFFSIVRGLDNNYNYWLHFIG